MKGREAGGSEANGDLGWRFGLLGQESLAQKPQQGDFSVLLGPESQ